MDKNSKKNYVLLSILLVITFIITIAFSRLYLNRIREESLFYKESNKITAKEIEQISLENTDIIYYISNKNDLTHASFEEKLKTKLEEKNLLNKLIYVDTKKSIIKKFKKEYKLNLKVENYPIIVFVVDNKVVKTIYASLNDDIDNYIDYGVYE